MRDPIPTISALLSAFKRSQRLGCTTRLLDHADDRSVVVAANEAEVRRLRDELRRRGKGNVRVINIEQITHFLSLPPSYVEIDNFTMMQVLEDVYDSLKRLTDDCHAARCQVEQQKRVINDLELKLDRVEASENHFKDQAHHAIEELRKLKEKANGQAKDI